MASIVKRGSSWQALVCMPDRSRPSKRFARRSDAVKWATQLEARRDQGQWVRGADRVTVAEVAQVWARGQMWRPSTRETHEHALRGWVLPTFGSRRVVSLRWSEIQAWVVWMSAEGLAPSTVERHYRTFASVLSLAKADRLIQENPATVKRVRLPKRARSTGGAVIFSASEMWSLVDALPDRMRAFGMVGAGAGLRPGEIAGLTVDCLDLVEGWVDVKKQISTSEAAGREFGPLKTEASERRVPIPLELAADLSEHLERWPAVEWHGERLVFSTRHREPVSRSQRSTVWRDAAKGAGLYQRGQGWHQLRHFYASSLIHAGESVATVQARLGHASPAETLDTYIHLWPGSESSTRDAVADVWRAKTCSLATSAAGVV